MQPDQQKKLDQTYELEKENNFILKKMRRVQKASNIFSLIYWIIILGSILGLFYFLEPYFEKLGVLYTDGAKIINSFNTTTSQFENFFQPKTTTTPPTNKSQ